jgi:microcystin-dependent protein
MILAPAMPGYIRRNTMAEAYVSEIRIFSFNFAPRGWSFCNGQTLPINQNQVLFALIGTTYGGNGVTTFQLPNLQGNVPISMGNSPAGGSYTEGEVGGQANVTLTYNEMPMHTHTMQASAVAATQNSPTSNSPAQPVSAVGNIYGPVSGAATMAQQAVGVTGGSQPHNNMQPYLVLNFCIALQGIFPTRN